MIVGVAVDQANYLFDKLFSYSVPDAMISQIALGSIVLVPFGRGTGFRMGIVLSLENNDNKELLHKVKPIIDCAPTQATLTPDLLLLVNFVRERTFCSYYEAVKAMIPFGAQYRVDHSGGTPSLKKGIQSNYRQMFCLNNGNTDDLKLTVGQQKAVSLLKGGPLSSRQLKQNGVSRDILNRLCEKDILSAFQEEAFDDIYDEIPFQPEELHLNSEQQNAYDALASELDSQSFCAALLHGVTGSGKTIVFVKLIQKVLQTGRQALVLVPEIGLTPQMIARLKRNFGSKVAVQHSGLSNTERLVQWRMIQSGKADIVVGTRSAVFAPLSKLGLIIIDEEQEHTYFSDASPRYSAHEVARMRAMQSNAVLVSASATPSIESYYLAKQNRLKLIKLEHRYSGNPLPVVHLVDVREELNAGNNKIIGLALAKQIERALNNRKQVILLLNRRGYNTVAKCKTCGKSLKCEYCSVPLVYHKAQKRLMCHYCGRILQPPPMNCPDCGGSLLYTGFGTQKIEEELHSVFPNARVLRMDQDTTGQKGAHDSLIQRFANQEYDILVGTQMVAKGLDFSNVVLVGVLGIDALLNGQSYRSYEQAFDLITQVVGRSGRSDLPGQAIIQTASTDNPILHLACKQDYDAFYQQEIGFRKIGLYPPFCSLFTIGFSGADEIRTLKAAIAFSETFVQVARGISNLPARVLGPAPMAIPYLNGHYRYKLTLKCRNDSVFRETMRKCIDDFAQKKGFSGVSVTFDFHSDGE